MILDATLDNNDSCITSRTFFYLITFSYWHWTLSPASFHERLVTLYHKDNLLSVVLKIKI